MPLPKKEPLFGLGVQSKQTGNSHPELEIFEVDGITPPVYPS